MVSRYFDGKLPAASELLPADEAVIATAKAAVSGAESAIDKVAIHEAIAKSWTLVDELNGYITTQEPWVLAKDPASRERLGTVLNTATEGLRVLSVLLAPVMPKATKKLFAAIAPGQLLENQNISTCANWGQLEVGTELAELEPLFPRVEEQ
jgi:methionyl-tRNA synthetase